MVEEATRGLKQHLSQLLRHVSRLADSWKTADTVESFEPAQSLAVRDVRVVTLKWWNTKTRGSQSFGSQSGKRRKGRPERARGSRTLNTEENTRSAWNGKARSH